MQIIFFLICIVFIIYEIALHKYYKEDLQNEKLISYFSNTRMQVMKMLYMKEITANSCYFNFMIRATSYAIRTIYYKKKKLSIEQLEYLESMLNFINAEDLKKEFKNLNSEQKELFARTALNLLKLYFDRALIKKLVWTLYILNISSKIIKCMLRITEKLMSCSKLQKDKDIIYLKDVEKSYGLSHYAYAS